VINNTAQDLSTVLDIHLIGEIMKSFLAIVLLLPLFFTQSILAKDIDCKWQKSTNHSEGFYRLADFNFTLTKSQFLLRQDTFLNRTYTPCWLGSYSSCKFGFTYEKDARWSVKSKTNNTISLSAPAYYWSAELYLEFSTKMSSLQSGNKFMLTMSGDDGDGVFFHKETFSCQML